MVHRDLAGRGVRDQRVLDAMGSVPREAFVPAGQRRSAYADRALPLRFGQTVSQPYVVAVTLEALRLAPGDRALEVGAGSGYAAAVAGRLVAEVFAVERIESLAADARQRLESLGFDNVTVVWADGAQGHPPGAPYDAIFLSAATRSVPAALFKQLAVGGRLVAPVGGTGRDQQLALYEKPASVARSPDDVPRRSGLLPVAFVPLLPGVKATGK
ncbi:MAG: protein-L-isoaspartate(D-aspartate) O-methyltransferase [Acidimicrobiia bacterium]|nr:protein-L-isoaspartate(D-aspartate) O-methyltransferase [Acidimicrobiia bacterium]